MATKYIQETIEDLVERLVRKKDPALLRA